MYKDYDIPTGVSGKEINPITDYYGLVDSAEPCPFCGDKYVTAQRRRDGLIYIGCQTCNCFGGHDNHRGVSGTLETAIKFWNRRDMSNVRLSGEIQYKRPKGVDA